MCVGCVPQLCVDTHVDTRVNGMIGVDKYAVCCSVLQCVAVIGVDTHVIGVDTNVIGVDTYVIGVDTHVCTCELS